MDQKHVSSPVDLVEKVWRGPVLGVIKISAKAGFIAALLLAGLVGLIVYGISTAGHRSKPDESFRTADAVVERPS
jgi:hypothetical protein